MTSNLEQITYSSVVELTSLVREQGHYIRQIFEETKILREEILKSREDLNILTKQTTEEVNRKRKRRAHSTQIAVRFSQFLSC